MQSTSFLSSACSRRQMLRGLLMGGAALLTSGFLPASVRALGLDVQPLYKRADLFMGTVVNVHVAQAPAALAAEAVDRALHEGHRLAALFDRHSAASALSVLNRQGRLDHAPVELLSLLRQAQALHHATQGAFDVTVLPLLQLPENADAARRRDALDLVGSRHVRLDGSRVRLERQGMGVTLDGIAKGAIVDAMSAVLARSGCPNHLVEAGGDIMARGHNADGGDWCVAVEDPYKRHVYPAVFPLRNAAIATSGNYEQKTPHLLAPQNGRPSRLLSCSIVADSCCQADALATGLSLAPAPAVPGLAQAQHCAAFVLDAGGQPYRSRRWPA